MYWTFVSSQIWTSCKIFTTTFNIANIGSLSCVNSHVNSKSVPARVKTITNFTRHSFVTIGRMSTQMSGQSGFERETFITYRTGERTFSGVSSHMTNKIWLFSKHIRKNNYNFKAFVNLIFNTYYLKLLLHWVHSLRLFEFFSIAFGTPSCVEDASVNIAESWSLKLVSTVKISNVN